MNQIQIENLSFNNMECDPDEYQSMRGMAQGILWALNQSPKDASQALHAAHQMEAVAREKGQNETDLPYLQGWIKGLKKVLSFPEDHDEEGGADDRVY